MVVSTVLKTVAPNPGWEFEPLCFRQMKEK